MAVSALLHPLLLLGFSSSPTRSISRPRITKTPTPPLFHLLACVAPASTTASPLMPLLHSPPRRSTALVPFARRPRKTKGEPSKHMKEKEEEEEKIMIQEDEEVEGHGDEIDEDAFEALFSQLEEDLKSDEMLDDDGNNELTEEDLAKLEQELEEAFADGDFSDIFDASPSSSDSVESDIEAAEEGRRPVLKNWQLKRLARALKIGRRKTSIKSLAAELGLDRAFVLELLRDPPPTLLLLSASLPDEVPQTLEYDRISLTTEVTHAHEEESTPLVSLTASGGDTENIASKVKLPVHVMRSRWSAQKRLKKVHVTTLEKVYSRTKRPTNAMVSSIVHVTNLPRQIVVKWFEDKRLQGGVPESRAPFRRMVHGNESPS